MSTTHIYVEKLPINPYIVHMLSNYHTHCRFCDGSDEPEAYVTQALETGLRHIGFSSHTPVDFETDWHMKEHVYGAYRLEVLRLREAYGRRIGVHLGLEVDFLTDFGSSLYDRKDFDYIIGSYHFLGLLDDGTGWTVDNSHEEFELGLEATFGGDIRKAAAKYYQGMRRMAETLKPDVVAHLDLFKKNNRGGRYFQEDSEWYRREVLETLDHLGRCGCRVEINTGGKLRNKTDDFYPSGWIIREMRARNIPVVLSSDAHTPGQLVGLFDEAAGVLREAGYRSSLHYTGKGWVEYPL